ncbi:site-specific integrase [Lacticaseibacillus sp. 866-1]|uniref:site-specific integrase n=1 Tax=Lacticaseibacillus sp. 866-1 TaxID=2799576 RepID=UPI001942B4C7|nr:site-specific integrase [Lacticaseibacillus sp. 866-1]
MASISSYKTGSGIRWKAQVYIGEDPKTGKKRYTVKGGNKTKTAAVRAGRELEKQVANGSITIKPPKPKAPTFKAVYEDWLTHYKFTVRTSSLQNTLNCFNLHILPILGDMLVDEITEDDMQKAVEAWYGQTTFYKRYYRHAKRVLKYAKMKGYLSEVPCENIILPTPQDRPGSHAEFWDKDQLNKFFACFNPDRNLKKLAYFRILAYAGLRSGECIALEWEDVDLSKQTINVNKTQSQGLNGRTTVNPPKTKTSRRIVPIDDGTVAILKRWREEQHLYLGVGYYLKPSHQLLFTTRTNERIRSKVPANWLREIIQHNGLTPSISLHKLRKSYVSNLLIAGVPVSVVQKLVGHADPTITLRIYAQVHQEQEVDAAKTLADYLKDDDDKNKPIK